MKPPSGLFDLYGETLDGPEAPELEALYENPVVDGQATFDADMPPTYENPNFSDPTALPPVDPSVDEIGGGEGVPSSPDLTETQRSLEVERDGLANLLQRKAKDRETATQLFQKQVYTQNVEKKSGGY